MVDTPRKTFPELQALSAPVVDTDVLAVYRTPGPAKRTTASVLGSYVNTVIGTAFTRTLLATASNNAFLAALGQIASSFVDFIQSGTGAITRTAQAKLRDVVSVKDFGAVGDGITNDTVAIQAALNSGASKVVFPKGVYVTGALTLPAWTHIEGDAYQAGIGGSGRLVELRFTLTADVAALDCGVGVVIKNVFLQNIGGSYNETTKVLSGTASQAVKLSANCVIEDVCWSSWYECVRFGADSYYTNFIRPHFNRCTFGFRAFDTTPYNINIEQPLSVLTNIFFSGTGAFNPRNVKVQGGSIEGYATVAQLFADISFFGTYFETAAPRSGCFAIDPQINNSNVSLFGCLIYMNVTARFVNMASLTNCSLTSHGNVYDGVAPASAVCLWLPSSGNVSAGFGDTFGTGHPTTATFYDAISSAANHTTYYPPMPAGNAHVAFDARLYQGRGGVYMGVLTAEPTDKPNGMLVCADGDSWDPMGYAQGRPYWVLYQGDRWRGAGGGGPKTTGFGAITGTATKTAIATYTAPTISATYTQAEVQAIANALQETSRRQKAIDDALRNVGTIID